MKTFFLSDGSVNCYGFRVLTSGIDVPQFRRNPVMLWMHNRGGGENSNTEQVLPLGTWSNIRVEGDQLLAEPDFDVRDSFALKIKDKVEAGIIRMASIGISSYDVDDSPALKLPGQQGGTVTKCRLTEASIVDSGANYNAVALYASGANSPMSSAEVRLHVASLQMAGSAGDSLTSDPAFALSYDELHRGTGLELLRSRNYPLFCMKLYQKFGSFPKDCSLDAATKKLFELSKD